MKAMTELRISAHNLEIGKGRLFRTIPIPAEERFCRHCVSKVEDEIHFITECPLYENIRKELLGPYTDKNKPNLHLFQAFSQSEDTPTLSKLANFIFKANNVRELNTSAHT